MANLVVTAGPGHGHNELLSYIFNHNSTIYSDYDDRWQMYPGEYGNYIRVSDDWNINHSAEYHNLYHNELRHTGPQSITPSEVISKLRKAIHGFQDRGDLSRITSNSYMSQYVNCMNLEDVTEYSHALGLPVITCKADLKESKHRSSLAQMEFSVHGAEPGTYSEVNEQVICRWLSVKESRQEHYDELKVDVVVSANDLLTDDKELFDYTVDSLYKTVGCAGIWNPKLWDKIQYIKLINDPIHPFMMQLDRMSWEELEKIRFHGL
jgi:hypothetical protein